MKCFWLKSFNFLRSSWLLVPPSARVNSNFITRGKVSCHWLNFQIEVSLWMWSFYCLMQACKDRQGVGSWLTAMGSQAQMLAWMCLLMLLLGITCTSNRSLVKVNKGLKVKRGQAGFLQEGDLQFHIPHQKDACKLEVVGNEPITQRVGKLMPQVMNKKFYMKNSVFWVV